MRHEPETRSCHHLDMLEPVDDADLVRRVDAGDTEALRALYERYGGIVFGMSFRLLGDRRPRRSARRTFSSRSGAPRATTTGRARVSTWLFTIARNRAIDATAAKRGAAQSTRTRRSGRRTRGRIPQTSSRRADDAVRVAAAWRSCPDAQREALSLAYFEGLSHSRDRGASGFPPEQSRDGSGWGSTGSACSLPSRPRGGDQRMTDDRPRSSRRRGTRYTRCARSRTSSAAELERDSKLAAELEDYRATVATLESSMAREQPSHDLFAGILAEIEPRRPVRAAAKRPSRPGAGAARCRRSRSARRDRCAVFAVALALDSSGGGHLPMRTRRSQGTPEFADVHGEARIYGSAQRRRRPAARARRRPGCPGEPALGGVGASPLRGRGDGGRRRLRCGRRRGRARARASRRRRLRSGGHLRGADAGPPEHSGTSLAGGTFERPTT